ncbi:MAG: PAS domain S-box protein [Candidatus Omnitrophica bacterium]|nr:PAS domain S-box protein [Candidatus Omnitrophota bacterium]
MARARKSLILKKPSKSSRRSSKVLTQTQGKLKQAVKKFTTAEKALKEQEDVLFTVIEHAPTGMVMADAGGKIVLVNLEIERLFGYKRDELLGRKIEILIPESLRKRHVEHRENFSKEPSPRLMGAGRDLAGRRKDGTEFPIEVGLNPLTTPQGLFVLAAIMDISTRKELEKRAITSEHLAAVGKLSSHVAHEIRNPLSSISLNLDLLHDEFQALTSEENKERLKEVEVLLDAVKKEIERLSDLASGYLKFSRMSKHQKEKTDLEEFFSKIVYLLEAESAQKGIQIQFPRKKMIVSLDPRQMQQVFLNLIRNSMEAMPKGGRIGISIDQDEEKTLISIRDEGTGMDEETQKKLFDPFYTTKEKGTGLGLSLVRQIILEHQGDIRFQSSPGQGTAFFIELPLTASPSGPTALRGGGQEQSAHA